MPPSQLVTYASADALLADAAVWDDLWLRSDVTVPTVQAAHVAQWLSRFSEGGALQALAVKQDGRLVAALPLITRRLRGMVPVAALTGNEWTPAADLLLDSATDVDAALDLLVTGLAQLEGSLLWLDVAVISAPRWQQFMAACRRQGLSVDTRPRFDVMRLKVPTDWDAYRRSWSRNHRRNLARARRKLEADHGPVQMRRLIPREPTEVKSLLQRALQIEDRSWKGAGGTSVLRSPGMLDYFEQQALLLAEREQLELAFLEAGGKSIAFEYMYRAKGIAHPLKCGYDEALARYSPGQLLVHDLLESFSATGDYTHYDCLGPTMPAHTVWGSGGYQIGRIVIAPPGVVSQGLFFAYRHVVPTLRRWRKDVRQTAEVGV